MFNRMLYNPLLWFIIVLSLSACTMMGSTVSVDKRTSLQPGNYSSGFYKDTSLEIEFRHSVKATEFELSGNIHFKGMNAGSLDVRLLVLDSAGTVIQQKLVYSSGYRTMSARGKKLKFNTRITLPEEATSFSFSHSSQPANGQR